MVRMHTPGKGMSRSALPYRRTTQSWFKTPAQEIVDRIHNYARKGLKPSQIGVILRDSGSVSRVRQVTGSSILRILKAEGLQPKIPEDLYYLIKKAVNIRRHLAKNRRDKDSKFRLVLVEARIHRLARYYRKKKVVEPNFKYESSTASALV